MNLDSFEHGESFLHRCDPRVKIGLAVSFTGVVAVLRDPVALVCALVLSAVWIATARLPWGSVGRRLLLVDGFVALLWIFLPFTQPGAPVGHVGPLTVTRAGIVLAAVITLRTQAIVLATMALLGTSSVFSLVHALSHLRMPVKLTQLAFFSLRYVDVIRREYGRLHDAMRVRCFRPRTSVHTYRSYAYLVGMLLVRSFERSQRVYQAMLCRGYRGRFPVYHHFSLTRADRVFGVTMLMLVLALTVV